jgi:endoglucanase
VTGGWYDAGDHGKYVVNGGISLWTLLNLFEVQQLRRSALFADKTAKIPEAGNSVSDLLDEAHYELEFFLRMQAPEGSRQRLPIGEKRNRAGLTFTEIDTSGMVHHKVGDERWTGIPMRPDKDPEKRLLFPPSTSATLNFAATTAQCARIWRQIDPAFAAKCLSAAKHAWAAAIRNPEVYAIADFTGSGGYGDRDVSDEFYWAAAELFVTTGDPEYRNAATASPHFTSPIHEAPGWPSTGTLGTIALALHPEALGKAEADRLRAEVAKAGSRYVGESGQTGYHVPYTGRWGWGSTAVLLNRAMLIALAHDWTGDAKYRDGVVDVMDFLLGRNPLDVSFISGYGTRSMQNPHHRFWAHSIDPKYPPPPPGVISGGPNENTSQDDVAKKLEGKCAPQTCWTDDIRAYSLNEVAINWNAPLVWVSAWLADSSKGARGERGR